MSLKVNPQKVFGLLFEKYQMQCQNYKQELEQLLSLKADYCELNSYSGHITNYTGKWIAYLGALITFKGDWIASKVKSIFSLLTSFEQ